MTLDHSGMNKPMARTVGHIIGQIIGWALYAVGILVWAAVIPVVAMGKILGNEAGRFENDATVLSLLAYGAISLAGLTLLASLMGTGRLITKIALGIYLALLAVGVVVRVM